MVVTPYILKEDVTALHNKLHKIERYYTLQMCRQEPLSKVPDLCVFMTSPVSLTPYSTWVVKAWYLNPEELAGKVWAACG